MNVSLTEKQKSLLLKAIPKLEKTYGKEDMEQIKSLSERSDLNMYDAHEFIGCISDLAWPLNPLTGHYKHTLAGMQRISRTMLDIIKKYESKS